MMYRFLGIQSFTSDDIHHRYELWFRNQDDSYSSLTCLCDSSSSTEYGHRRVEVPPLQSRRRTQEVPFFFQTMTDAPQVTICPSYRMTSFVYSRPLVVNEHGEALVTDFGIVLDCAPQIHRIIGGL
jgi:hypothetical protein